MSGQAAYLEDDFEDRAQYAVDLLDGKPLVDVDPGDEDQCLACPDCGASLQPNARLDALRCPGCGFTQDIDQEGL